MEVNPAFQVVADGEPMATAPMDGTRILIHYASRMYKNHEEGYVTVGHKWVEAFYNAEANRWQLWLGDMRYTTTDSIHSPIGWASLPGGV